MTFFIGASNEVIGILANDGGWVIIETCRAQSFAGVSLRIGELGDWGIGDSGSRSLSI